jgi:hypothetical protein
VRKSCDFGTDACLGQRSPKTASRDAFRKMLRRRGVFWYKGSRDSGSVGLIFAKHPAFVPPERDEYKIWRYMDFTKFVSVLVRRSLYFASLKKMSDQDPFEGLLPDTYFECRSWKTVEDIPEHERWRLTLHKAEPSLHSLPWQTPLRMVKSSMEDFARLVFLFRKGIYVNCWHMSNFDSAAMWSIYAGRGSGIAITSSYDSLQASFRSDQKLFGGKIVYSDYSTDIIDVSNNLLTTTMRKRRSFEFEREFRIVFWDDSSVNEPGGLKERARKLETYGARDGLEFPCDLATLINEIYVSPKSEDWFLKLVQSVVQTYGLDKEVRRSPMDVHPVHRGPLFEF